MKKTTTRTETCCDLCHIVEALRNENAVLKKSLTIPDNHVRGPDGVDRRVLGKLPMTADGCVAGVEHTGSGEPMTPVYHPDFDSPGELNFDWLFVGGTDRLVSQFYSTREAALAARTGKEGE